MKFEKTEVWGFEHAIRGMRNPLESWNKSDSLHCAGHISTIGKNDLVLMQRLIKAGSEHRKFLRQIFVSVDITAPAYFMAELDTYKIGVTRNSSSFQHKGTSKRFTIEDFEVDYEIKEVFEHTLDALNSLRDKYIETKDYKYFRGIRQLLPQSYLYHSTITMNYENIFNMYHQRKHHKLTEWSESFINWVQTLPYAQELLFLDELEEKKNDK